MNLQDHWEKIFDRTPDEKLGWFEKDVGKTMELLSSIENIQDMTMFLPGAGTSLLVDELVKLKANLILNDISRNALTKLRNRIGGHSERIIYLEQNIGHPISESIPKVDVWIDRAVLHFLNDENEILTYFDNLRFSLKKNAFALFAEFSKSGASKCAGLPVHRYSIDELQQRLGSDFKLLTHFHYHSINPRGDSRPYVYALFERTGLNK